MGLGREGVEVTMVTGVTVTVGLTGHLTVRPTIVTVVVQEVLQVTVTTGNTEDTVTHTDLLMQLVEVLESQDQVTVSVTPTTGNP